MSGVLVLHTKRRMRVCTTPYASVPFIPLLIVSGRNEECGFQFTHCFAGDARLVNVDEGAAVRKDLERDGLSVGTKVQASSKAQHACKQARTLRPNVVPARLAGLFQNPSG